MRKRWMAAAVVGAALTGPATAQSLNDAGRLLQQFLPGQQPQQQPGQSQADRDRAIYEQGRRDAQEEQARRRQDTDRGRDPRDDRRYDNGRRADDRPRYDPNDNRNRRRGDPDRPYDDTDRPPPPPGRYLPPDNR